VDPSWKQSEAFKLLVQEYTAALMSVTLGVSMGLLEERIEYLGLFLEVWEWC